MTTNLAESMNSVLKGTRNLPIKALVKSTYFKLVDLFVQRGKHWNAVLNSETVNHNEGRPMGNFMVDLLNKCCDCGRFQALHLPCSHVIAACSSVHQSYQVYISEVYQVSTVFNVYNEPFQVIRNEDFWPSFRCIKL
uniref:SWIM-type domain-containing protein n=1 Tax=Trifolium repens TaxID=3899 RepID=D3YBC6_TRIRP|nr:unknown [Trifolium repens]